VADGGVAGQAVSVWVPERSVVMLTDWRRPEPSCCPGRAAATSRFVPHVLGTDERRDAVVLAHGDPAAWAGFFRARS
jgi:hypothetical protein